MPEANADVDIDGQEAPELGEGTDVGTEVTPSADGEANTSAVETEQTMDTPDDLGGTGGEQAGGAG